MIETSFKEILNKNRRSVEAIEAKTGKSIDWNQVVEVGLEVIKNKADRQHYLQVHQSASKTHGSKSVSRDVAIRDNIESVSTWDNLVSKIEERYAELAPNLSSVKPPTTPPVANHKYYFESQVVEKATDGNYRVDKVGNIKSL